MATLGLAREVDTLRTEIALRVHAKNCVTKYSIVLENLRWQSHCRGLFISARTRKMLPGNDLRKSVHPAHGMKCATGPCRAWVCGKRTDYSGKNLFFILANKQAQRLTSYPVKSLIPCLSNIRKTRPSPHPKSTTLSPKFNLICLSIK